MNKSPETQVKLPPGVLNRLNPGSSPGTGGSSHGGTGTGPRLSSPEPVQFFSAADQARYWLGTKPAGLKGQKKGEKNGISSFSS